MSMLAAIFGIATVLQGFTLDASGSGSVVLPVPVDSARSILRRVSTLEHHMPGVDAIEARPDGGYDYRTVREIPFSGEMRTEFVVRCLMDETGRLVYRTPDTSAGNWMQFRFTFAPAGEGRTSVQMDLRVRLVREKGTDIHLLAPLLGEEFLSEQMQNDITDMLTMFGERLERHCLETMAGRDVHAR